VLAQLAAQLIVAEAERARGRPLIVAVRGQGILQELTLEGGDRPPEIEPARRVRGDGAAVPPMSRPIIVEAGRLVGRWRRAERRCEWIELHLRDPSGG
jgi:hypothetical protein